MKSRILVCILGSCVFAGVATAATPLLVHQEASGFTPPEWRFSTTCEIYLDRVEQKTTLVESGVTVSRSFPVTISANISDVIAAAKKETFESGSTICDGGYIATSAYLPGSPDPIVLFAESTCSDDGERQGAASFHLKKIVASFCK